MLCILLWAMGLWALGSLWKRPQASGSYTCKGKNWLDEWGRDWAVSSETPSVSCPWPWVMCVTGQTFWVPDGKIIKGFMPSAATQTLVHCPWHENQALIRCKGGWIFPLWPWRWFQHSKTDAASSTEHGMRSVHFAHSFTHIYISQYGPYSVLEGSHRSFLVSLGLSENWQSSKCQQ